MQELLLHKLAKNCLSRFNLERLNLSQQWYLLNVYNKRYVEYMVEYGSFFDLYENDFHKIYKSIATENRQIVDAETLNAIENYTIFSKTSSAFFFEESIQQTDIYTLRELIDLGIFSFLPTPLGVDFADFFYIKDGSNLVYKDLKNTFNRSELCSFPILFNLPNVFNLDKSFAFKHFKNNNPKISKYILAMERASIDSRNLKKLNDSFSILILLDFVMISFSQVIEGGMTNPLDQFFLEFLDLIDSTKALHELTTKEYFDYLTLSKINAVAGWFFNCNALKKKARLEFIALLTSGSKNSHAIVKYILENHLYPSH